jgi:hypothetical protein
MCLQQQHLILDTLCELEALLTQFQGCLMVRAA